MAKQLPARGSFPDTRGEMTAFPGLVHVDADVSDVVQGQHYATAYYGRQHIPGQHWPAARVRESAGAMTRVLAYSVEPRLDMSNGVEFRGRVTSTHGGTVRVRCVETATNTDVAVGAGTVYFTGTQAMSRADTETTIEVYLQRDVAGDIDLRAFALWDRDLDVATLP